MIRMQHNKEHERPTKPSSPSKSLRLGLHSKHERGEKKKNEASASRSRTMTRRKVK
jgi:hypothetical protein